MRTRRFRIGGAAACLAMIGVVALASASVSLAVFTAQPQTTASFATDTLAPATALSAVGGTTAVLSWTATVRTYAAGYHMYRAAALAGPYALLATVTPRTTTTYADAPAPGTYYYTVRAYYQSWESADAGPVSAVVVAAGPIGTGYLLCTSNVADTSGAGDNNGYEGSSGNACLGGATPATDSNSGTSNSTSCGSGTTPSTTKDRHRFWGFGLGLPAAVSAIGGIEVQADLALNSNSGTTNLCSQLSWDGGTTWTAIKVQAIATAGRTTYTFGTSADLWGHAWTLAELSSTSLQVRIIDASSSGSKQFKLYAVRVQVTYTP